MESVNTLNFLNTLNILIVDDDRLLAETTARGLQNALGNAVHVDASFESTEVLSWFENRIYDVVISDYSMPGKTGLELLKDVRAAYPNTLLVMMTAYGTDDLEAQAHELTEAYITKPFELSVLVKFVQSLLDVQQEEGEENNHILVLEDDVYLRRLISKVLKNHGYKVFEVDKIKEARKMLQTNRYSIFMSDVQVPDGLGTELIQECRDKLTDDDTTVIMITGEARYRYQEDELGIDMYLEKPIAINDLVTLVQRLLGAKAASQA